MTLGAAALFPPIAIGVGVTIGFVGAALVLTGAAQLAYLAAASTLGQAIVGPDAPPFSYTVRYHTGKMLESATENVGIPVMAAAVTAAAAIAEQAARYTGIADLSPKGGTIEGAAGLSADGTTRPMKIYQGTDAVQSLNILVMPTQSNKTIADATAASPDLSWFDGAYLGTINVVATAGGKQDSGNFDFSFTVLGGVVTIIDPTGGAGSVSANGRMRSSLGNCSVNGTLQVTAPGPHGPGGGSGQLPVCVNGDYTGWGSWSVSRAPRP
jgi:hypothetical protein